MKSTRLECIELLLSVSKRASWLEKTLLQCKIHVYFLQDHGLVTHQLIEDGEDMPLDFEFLVADHKEEGYKFFAIAVQKWYRAIDRVLEPNRSTILEHELVKMRPGESIND